MRLLSARFEVVEGLRAAAGEERLARDSREYLRSIAASSIARSDAVRRRRDEVVERPVRQRVLRVGLHRRAVAASLIDA